MRPELVFPFPARYELVFHERVPHETGLPVWNLPAAAQAEPQQELALAPIVEVRPAEAGPWIGIFHAEEANNIRGTLIGWPDERSVCFFGGHGAYLVKTADPRRITPLADGPIQQYYVAEEAGIILFVVNFTQLAAYSAGGLLWTSDVLASDDVVVVGVADDAISCTGFFGARTDVPFAVDLATGEQHKPDWRA